MKIQCDACGGKAAALVFCTADEAALCAACDHRVHRANKLAVKHHRFTLHSQPTNQTPLCDICQERKAFMFCQQDRAILCWLCDGAIHQTNEHTRKHARFLLTGVILSPNSAPPPSSPPESPQKNNHLQPVPTVCTPAAAQGTTAAVIPHCEDDSGISECLKETTQPGWHFEYPLNSSSFPTFWDADLEDNISTYMGGMRKEEYQWSEIALNNCNNISTSTSSRSRREMDQSNCFAVPQHNSQYPGEYSEISRMF